MVIGKGLGILTRQLLKNRFLWTVVTLVILFAVYYYAADIAVLDWLAPQGYLGLTRQAFQRALFLIPVFVAAWKLGLRGGVACTVIVGTIMVPMAMESSWRTDAIVETAVIVIIGIVSTRLVSSLEEARNLQQALADDLKKTNERLELEITGRRRAEESIKEIKDKHETLIGNIPDAVCSCLPDEVATPIFISDRWEDWTGYSAQDFYQDRQTWLKSVHSEDRDRVVRTYAGACENRVDFDCEYRVVHRDTRRVRYVRGYGMPVTDETGNIIRFDSVIPDITDQKYAKQIQRINADLAASNKEMEAFSYSVSHDLRAPLRSIDGFSQALLDDYSDRLDEEGKDYLKRLRLASQRMGLLIDDILKLSRITRAEMQYQEVDLTTLAGVVVVGLRNAQAERRVEFIIASGLNTVGDSGLLRILLENLLGNAWKFTGKQPDAIIEFGTTRFDGKQAFFVRDNGVGFDMAYANRLFGAFQRLHTVDEFDGSGIGLATVQRIARRHGGRVWAEGEVGVGATFYFTLQ